MRHAIRNIFWGSPFVRPVGERVRWGNLRSVNPVSKVFGLDRGTPVDRYYIENFLAENSAEIQGRVLEIADAHYTRKFGGRRVEISDVLHATADNDAATIVGDLATGEGIPHDRFDCLILTQTLPFIYDVPSAIRNAHRALASGGTLLATFAGISQISRYDMDRWGDFWRFTDLSARKLFEEVFGQENVEVVTYGNVLAATAMLQGISAEELKKSELDFHDRDYQVTIAIRAKKASRPP